jgi:hypothetical protein
MKARKFEPLMLLIPAVYMALTFWMMGVRGPYNLGLNLDPEYQYLFNCTRLASGNFSTYVHHPGTPLQIVGAVVIFFKWLIVGVFAGWGSIAESVYADHTGYLLAINHALMGLLFIAVYLAGWQVYRYSNSWLAALVVQITPLLYMTPVEALPRVAPELPEVIAGLVLVVAIAPLVFGDATRKASADPRLAIAAGIALGFGIASKANFFTLLVLAFLFPNWKQMALFAGAAIASFMVLLAPIITELGQMRDWFLNMATHSGHYGTGGEGLPVWQEYQANFFKVFENEQFVPYLILLYLAALAVTIHATRGDDSERFRGAIRLLLIAPVGIVIHALITAKHFNYHYVVPALMLTVPVHGVLVWVLSSIRLSRRVKIAVVGLALILGYETGRANWHRMLWYQGWKAEYHESVATIAAERSKHPDCETIGYFRSSLPTFALSLGNSMSRLTYADALEKLYPGQVHFTGDQLRTWNYEPATPAVTERVASGACVLLQGEVANPPTLAGFELEPAYVPEVAIHGGEGLYRLRVAGAGEVGAQ